MHNNLPYPKWPSYENDEIQVALNTLLSGNVNYWTGNLGKEFEQAYANYVGCQYGIALSNGTVALELALRSLGVGVGDEVIVASRSYVASASCVLIVGATPVFSDVDADSGNISATTIEPLINHRTKAIIPVHVGGWPCDMQNIMDLAKKHNLFVIEDCAQAHGAKINHIPVGSWGHASIFSFCQDKIITTGGEGGMLLLNDVDAFKKAWAYKDIGRSYDAVFNRNHPEGFKWLTESTGSNYRMTEFQAAIGLRQLSKLDAWIDRRNSIATSMISIMKQFKFIEAPVVPEGYKNAFYRLYVKVNPQFVLSKNKTQNLRDFMIKEFNTNGVPCFVGSCAEIYLEKLFQQGGFYPPNRYQNARNFSDNACCFLVHPTINDEQLKDISIRMQETLEKIEKQVEHAH